MQDQRRTAIGLTHKVRRRKERPVAVAVGALVGILGLAAVLGLSSSMYPDRVHSLSAEDLEKLRELHAAQYGTLQERDALLEEGAVDEHAWVNAPSHPPSLSGWVWLKLNHSQDHCRRKPQKRDFGSCALHGLYRVVLHSS